MGTKIWGRRKIYDSLPLLYKTIVHCIAFKKKWPLRGNGLASNDCLPYEKKLNSLCADSQLQFK